MSPLPNDRGFPIPTVPASATTAEALSRGRVGDRGAEAVARGEGTEGDARRPGQGFDSPRRRPYYQVSRSVVFPRAGRCRAGIRFIRLDCPALHAEFCVCVLLV